MFIGLQETSRKRLITGIFGFLHRRGNNLDPLSITVDFERAAINTINQIFPATNIHGCHFHFAQCLGRKIQDLHLANWYITAPENSLIVKMFQALAFLPPNQVLAGFDELMYSLDDGFRQRGRRRGVVFPIPLWNVYDRIHEDLPRTNNSVEGWHNAFNLRVGVSHPTVRKLVEKIQKEQADNELLLQQVRAGAHVRAPKRIYRQLDGRLVDIVEHIDHYHNNVTFLRFIAHNL